VYGYLAPAALVDWLYFNKLFLGKSVDDKSSLICFGWLTMLRVMISDLLSASLKVPPDLGRMTCSIIKYIQEKGNYVLEVKSQAGAKGQTPPPPPPMPISISISIFIFIFAYSISPASIPPTCLAHLVQFISSRDIVCLSMTRASYCHVLLIVATVAHVAGTV
jgi:hypothetical protein